MMNGAVDNINIVHDRSSTYNGLTKTIDWNPELNQVVTNGGTTGIQSPALILGHEFAHGADLDFFTHTSTQQENFAHAIESWGAQELFEPTRATYYDVAGFTLSHNPTEHTNQQNIWTTMGQNGAITYGESFTGFVPAVAPWVGPAIDPNYFHNENQNPICLYGYWTITADPIHTNEYGDPFYKVNWVSDPVIINLTGNPVQTQGLEHSKARFDMQNNGHAIKTGWATAGEGLLVIDRGLSTIDSVNDLVPNIANLCPLDSNGDGVLTAVDAGWNSLKVWVDEKGTAKFSGKDLYSLDQLGISSINLNTTTVNENNHGNTIINHATFTFSDGRTGELASVELVAQAPALHHPAIAY
jgi:hypothetical protein